MHVRVFRDADMAAAMAGVRAALGAEALILGSRKVAGGVEVTAAIEPPPAPVAAAALPAHEAPASRRSRCLAWHNVPAGLARRLAAGPLPFALSATLRFAALPTGPQARLLLCGPPGAGKTLTIVRLATRLVLAGCTPRVVSTDTHRAGACAQLAAFLQVLGLPAPGSDVADGPAMEDAPLLVDTAGADPFDRSALASLAALAKAARAQPVLVLPAGLDAAEAAEIGAAHHAIGVRSLVATRLDAARRLGSVLAAAAAGLALTEAGIGPGAADGLVPLTPGWLARRMEGAAWAV